MVNSTKGHIFQTQSWIKDVDKIWVDMLRVNPEGEDLEKNYRLKYLGYHLKFRGISELGADITKLGERTSDINSDLIYHSLKGGVKWHN